MNISFKGRDEVIYGLYSGACKATEAEYARSAGYGPNPVNQSAREIKCMNELKNYLDSACSDECFLSTIEDLTKEEKAYFSKNLRHQSVQYCILNPMEKFSNALKDAFLKHHDVSKISILEKFISEIKKVH